jgi:transposase
MRAVVLRLELRNRQRPLRRWVGYAILLFVPSLGSEHRPQGAHTGSDVRLRREHEYKRHGTASLLAGINLVTGKVHALVKDCHRSREFIEFLKLLDAAYPRLTAIKLILDNHSAHISKETRAWLAEQPAQRWLIRVKKELSHEPAQCWRDRTWRIRLTRRVAAAVERLSHAAALRRQ